MNSLTIAVTAIPDRTCDFAINFVRAGTLGKSRGCEASRSAVGSATSQGLKPPMMIPSTSALAITGLLAATGLALPSLAPQIKARETSLLAKEAGVLAKAERPDIRPLADICSQQVWPNFDTSCLRSNDSVTPVRDVRLVTARR